MQKLSIIFIGTGEFGVPILESLCSNNLFKIPFVVTGQDKPAGRDMQTHFSPVKEASIKNNLSVHQPRKINDLKQLFVQYCPDVFLVVSYGEIIPKEILKIPRFGAVNIHASLLPKYRGASPIQESLLQGDKTSGITWILMDEHLDTGDIIDQIPIGVSTQDNFSSLLKKLSDLAAKMTPDVLQKFITSKECEKQNESDASYCHKISKADGYIDVHKESAQQIVNKIKAYEKWPGCYILWNSKRLKIIQAEVVEQFFDSGDVASDKGFLYIGTHEKTLKVLTVQPESKKIMTAQDFLRGQRKDFPRKLDSTSF